MPESRPSTLNLRAVITFLSGDLSQKSPLKLKKGGAIFGRENGDILILDHEVSATHCQIQWVKGECVLFDMNSSNGTFVNGQKILRQVLASGDVISIGKTKMLIRLAGEDEVRHIASVTQDANSAVDRTRIVDTLIEKEMKNTQKWEFLLTVTYLDGQKEQYRVQQNTLHLGRGTSFCRFEGDAQISRKHLLIKLNDNGEVFVEDEGSTNGSYLNGKKIKGIHLVGPKDSIRMGGCEVKIHSLARTP